MTTRDTITAFLAGKGLTAPQIAGVEGNLQVESGFNPAAANPREGAIGLAQWEGGRRTALQNYARAHGTSETDLNTQLGFLWSELQGPERGALTALTGSTSAAQAATVFDQQYERSSSASLPARVTAANNIEDGGGIGAGISTTLGQIAGAPAAAASAVLSGWQGGVLSIALKVAGAAAAAALVIVGAKDSMKGTATA